MPLTAQQKKVVLAAFLGWTLDAFDFFILVFTLPAIAQEFGVKVPDVAYAIFLTLAMRFIGAFIFGRLADRFGRKPLLMIDIVCFSILGAAAALAPSLAVFLVLRALFGIAMGGEWGLGSSLTMESIPPRSRGLVSGILQCGYPAGYLLASIVFGIFFGESFFGVTFGWRAMFLFSLLPALVVLFIRSHVPESPAFAEAQAKPKRSFLATLGAHWRVSLFAVVLMMFFNLFSHGTQDLYPVFLEKQHHFDHHTVSLVLIVANLGAIAGGLLFGHISEKIGRVNAITIASLLALPVISPVGLCLDADAPGARGLRHAIRRARGWGVIPVHLNEIVPGSVRATLPGFIYQAGNFLASYNGPFQAKLAEAPGNSYGYALALIAAVVAIAVAITIRFSPERRGGVMTMDDAAPVPA